MHILEGRVSLPLAATPYGCFMKLAVIAPHHLDEVPSAIRLSERCTSPSRKRDWVLDAHRCRPLDFRNYSSPGCDPK